MFKFVNLLKICFLFFINFSTFGKTLVINGNNYDYSNGYWEKNNVKINGKKLIKLIKEILAKHGLKGINKIMNIQNNKTGTNAIKELIMNYSEYCHQSARGASCSCCCISPISSVYSFNSHFLDFFDYDYGYANDKKCNGFHCNAVFNYSLDSFLNLFFNSDNLPSAIYVGELDEDGLYFFVIAKFKEPIAHSFDKMDDKKRTNYYNLELRFHIGDTISLNKLSSLEVNNLVVDLPIPYKKFDEVKEREGNVPELYGCKNGGIEKK